MSTTECATDPGPIEPQTEPAAVKPRKNILVGFAATVTVGLALASWYVGVRIVDAHEAVPPANVSATPVTPALPPPIAAPAPKHEKAAPPPAPPPPNFYLQVAGL